MRQDSSSGLRVRRGFADVTHGQVHYREAGVRQAGVRPVVMMHSSPTSSTQLIETILAVAARGRWVLAPDVCGNGDSTPLPQAQPSIQALASVNWEVLDTLCPGPIDLYGSHSGATIGLEMSIARPGQVAHFAIDGMALYPPEVQADMLANYLRTFKPDLDAAYVMQAWHFCRDIFVYWPWYKRDGDHRREGGLPPPAEFHAYFVEVLKNGETYDRFYRASMAHDKRARLPLLKVPTTVFTNAADPLHPSSQETHNLIAGSQLVDLGMPTHTGAGLENLVDAVLAFFAR